MGDTLADRPVHRREVAPVVEGHQRRPRLLDRVVHRAGAGWRRRRGRSTRRRPRPAGRRRTPASAASSRSPRRWRPGAGPGPTTPSRRRHAARRTTVPASAPGGITPAAASRPCRTTWTAQPVLLAPGGHDLGAPGQRAQPLGAGRAADEGGQPVTPRAGVHAVPVADFLGLAVDLERPPTAGPGVANSKAWRCMLSHSFRGPLSVEIHRGGRSILSSKSGGGRSSARRDGESEFHRGPGSRHGRVIGGRADEQRTVLRCRVTRRCRCSGRRRRDRRRI